MKGRKLIAIILGSLFLSTPFVLAAHADETKVGVVVPLTGTLASWGQDALNGIKFANEELAGGRYKLIVEDDKCDPREAVSVANKLINVDHVKFALGPACSGPLLAAAPLYERAEVVVIATAASAAKVSGAGDFIFRTWPSDAVGVRTLAQYIEERHRRLGILSEQTEYAQGLLDGMMRNKGALEIFSEEYAPGVNDFRTLLLHLRERKVDALLLNPQGDSTLLPMLTQINQMGFNIPKYAMYYGASETVRNLGSELTHNLVFADVPDGDAIATAAGKDVLAKFKSRYPIQYGPIAVISAIEAFRAFDAAVQSGQEPRKFLYSTRFNGIFGEWSFDDHGDIQGVPFVMKQIRDKQIVPISN